MVERDTRPETRDPLEIFFFQVTATEPSLSSQKSSVVVKMSTTSGKEPTEDLQAEPASSSQNSKPGETADHGEEEADAGLNLKAPVHDASSAAQQAPVVVQAQTKADLAKAAQTLKQYADEGAV